MGSGGTGCAPQATPGGFTLSASSLISFPSHLGFSFSFFFPRFPERKVTRAEGGGDAEEEEGEAPG